MKIKMLTATNYEDATSKNYGDCTIIDDDNIIVIYDCGSQEHAQRVIEYVNETGIEKVIVILSHNDTDHFQGIITLIEAGVVSCVYTTLLFKYIDEIYELIEDGRVTKNSVKENIEDAYNNIYSLSGQVKLKDIYQDDFKFENIEIIGPNKNFMLEVVAKGLSPNESDTYNGESITNATSIQVQVKIGDNSILLCGDSSFEPLEETIERCNIIQLPHHGKPELAEKIFNKKDAFKTKYIISDNTGNSNGGSSDLKTKGENVVNTKKDGDIEITENVNVLPKSVGNYGEFFL